VTVFFVLSGFLIGRILLRTIDRQDFNGHLLAQFWVRRFDEAWSLSIEEWFYLSIPIPLYLSTKLRPRVRTPVRRHEPTNA